MKLSAAERAPQAPLADAAIEADRLSLAFPASGEPEISVAAAPAEGGWRLSAIQAGMIVGGAEVRAAGEDIFIDVVRPDAQAPQAIAPLAALLAAVFQLYPGASRLLLQDPVRGAAVAAVASAAAAIDGVVRAVVERNIFHQLPLLWRMGGAHMLYPTIRSELGPAERAPPLRPPQPTGLMYRRHLPDLGLDLTLRPIDRRRDLALFHGWMNQKRVDFFWDMAKSEADLDKYLAEQEEDPHTVGVIGAVGDDPAAYFEFYWAKEDRLGAHYEADDYDRGWHGLIGNPRYLGRARTLAWFRSLTHYLFLDDPRTQRIVGEPRASHVKILSYCCDAAYDQVKEFDFPHKRAMLVMCQRDRFFREVPL